MHPSSLAEQRWNVSTTSSFWACTSLIVWPVQHNDAIRKNACKCLSFRHIQHVTEYTPNGVESEYAPDTGERRSYRLVASWPGLDIHRLRNKGGCRHRLVHHGHWPPHRWRELHAALPQKPANIIKPHYPDHILISLLQLRRWYRSQRNISSRFKNSFLLLICKTPSHFCTSVHGPNHNHSSALNHYRLHITIDT